ncbi:helix-turn-helix domain-containing protein [Paraeggerthella hongkongensis]|uniref:XRE family transcriptional regulator n=1 Tax=Paraeggerthella hongkongensis TaxID=230658 RepID=A0A3N0BLL3_9ACTN|nr:helix-turn-helix transcriptional regulator [Paraeggerthella hongkongensis]RNL49051.1 XRE family transcriptional regulator [Paraeggerthella hongkongensis]
MSRLEKHEHLRSKDPLACCHACELGENVRSLRKAQRLSQDRLAQMIGTKHPRISDIEYGLADLRISEIDQIARALDVRPSELLDLEAHHPRDFPLPPDGHAPL